MKARHPRAARERRSDRLQKMLADGRPMRIEAARNSSRRAAGASSLERLGNLQPELLVIALWLLWRRSSLGLCAVLGQQGFHRLSRAYLADCPSQSFTLRNLGARLASWLQRNPRYAGKTLDLALDMLRLEWAHIEAFDGAAEKVLGPEDLIELGPDFRRLQPYIRLLEFEYPVDKLLIQVNQASEEHEEASNAVLKQKHPGLARRVIRLKRERIRLAVHRVDFVVHYRRLAAEEYGLLNALREGQTRYGNPDPLQGQSCCERRARPAMLEKWFATWV